MHLDAFLVCLSSRVLGTTEEMVSLRHDISHILVTLFKSFRFLYCITDDENGCRHLAALSHSHEQNAVRQSPGPMRDALDRDVQPRCPRSNDHSPSVMSVMDDVTGGCIEGEI